MPTLQISGTVWVTAFSQMSTEEEQSKLSNHGVSSAAHTAGQEYEPARKG